MGKISHSRSEPRSDVICLEGNGYRPSHKGDGWRVGGAMYTLNSVEIHAVAYENFKADGAVGGGRAFAIVGDHENRPTDMTNLVIEKRKDEVDITGTPSA